MRVASLSEALGIRHRDVLAVVGAGGKTTLIGRLSAETVAGGGRVVVIATTHFSIPAEVSFPVVTAEAPRTLMTRVQTALETHPGVIVAGAPSSDGRHPGVPPEWVDALQSLDGWALTIVNADGARMRSFKAPAAHEPVIPACATLVVAVAGLDVVGAALDEARVFRPERVAAVAGVAVGAVVTEAVVASVLASREGGRRSIPAGARFVALLNKADDPAKGAAGARVAKLLHRAGVGRTVVASLRGRDYLVFAEV